MDHYIILSDLGSTYINNNDRLDHLYICSPFFLKIRSIIIYSFSIIIYNTILV